jgi:hypothetical protein
MDTPYGQCSLYLYPVLQRGQHDLTSEDVLQLVSVLQDIDFISQKINSPEANNNFSTGNQFLDYIAYMGCAPAIQFEAGESNSHFCFIKIHHYDAAKLIHSQKQSAAPRCPNCKKPVKNWEENCTNSKIFCDLCRTASNIEEFNWRKMAGYSQMFIEITDIFPKEAIPQQLLLDRLSEIFDINWLYFYSCN